jgi:hypothetical protein
MNSKGTFGLTASDVSRRSARYAYYYVYAAWAETV